MKCRFSIRVLVLAATLVPAGCTGEIAATVDAEVEVDAALEVDDAGNEIDARPLAIDDAGNVIDARMQVADAAPLLPDATVITADAAVGTCANITGDRRAQVCLRWKCDRASLSEGTWTGSVSPCNPGDIGAIGRGNALKLTNMFRFFADLPPVTSSPTLDTRAQQCALMMDANNDLSHTPPTSWTCYTTEGAAGAGKSNIASGPGVAAVDMYMSDYGNATTMGHRRWILSNSLGPIGLGSTSSASCMNVIGGSGNAGKPWMAWPAPGPFPIGAMYSGTRALDVTGWTFQSDTLDLATAQVAVVEGGVNRPVTVTQLGANYGARAAIRFTASGWTTAAGKSYGVTVSGLKTLAGAAAANVVYVVDVVACP